MPSEVYLLLPGLDLGAFNPLGVQHTSDTSIKAWRFLQLLPRKPATVLSYSRTINHRLSRRQVPLWELELSSYRHKVRPMLMWVLRLRRCNFFSDVLQALKFLPNHPVLPEDFPTTFVEYTSPRSTLAAPHPSPLAAKLLSVDGVSAVFYGADFITVTKAADANWAHIKPEVFSLITEAVTSGEQIVSTVEKSAAGDGQDGGEDTLSANEEDSEVVAMIKELLETRIRPAIQEDGGDIEFRGFEDGMVLLKLRGACRTCDSSTVTLKNGIESMLMHYVSGFDLRRPFVS
jgi:Fe-S cluster biogenesis protein NfuA